MKRFKNILYVAEPAQDQTAALARAVSLAENNQARLTLLRAIEPPGSLRPEEAREPLLAELEALAAPFRDRLEISVQARLGAPVTEIIREVLAERRDLIIKLAGPQEGLLDRLLGSSDLQLLRKAPCPVWILSPRDQDNYRQILAAVDFDPWRTQQDADALNRQILSLASSLALSDFADLHLVHCWEPISEQMMRLWTDTSDAASVANAVQTEQMRHQEGVSRLTHQLRDWIGEEAFDYLAPRVHLIQGRAREIIPELARTQHFDLVVMGTLGRAGLPGLLIGNTAEAILGQLECALLAVKPPGFVSPVTLSE